MNRSRMVFVTLVLLTLELALMLLLPGQGVIAHPGESAVLTICPAGPPDCQYDSVQAAVDAAGGGDLLKVAAGVYTNVQSRPVPPGYLVPPASGTITQVVYLDKALTIRGGYTAPGFADPPDPEINLTTLDAQGQGRVLFIVGSVSPVIEGLRFTGGDADGLGGTYWGYGDAGGGIFVMGATATVSDSRIFSNTAQFGGGLYLDSSSGTLVGNTITTNSASQRGGGVQLHEGTATLTGNTIAANTAGSGGGLYLWSSHATLDRNVITGNEASSGGGLYLYNGDDRLSGNVISSNTGNNNAGGLYLLSSQASLSGNTIQDNTAAFDGGGLYLEESEAGLSGNDILSNTANIDGGGLYLTASDAILAGNTISGNVTSFNGGGVALVQSAAVLSGNRISANTASQGGGAYLEESPAIVAGNSISGNILYDDGALGWGAGLSLWSSDAAINGNLVTGNTGHWTGGGISLYQSDATLDGNAVVGNSARYGAGLYFEHSSPVVSNTVVANNQAVDSGSGLYISGSGSSRLLHNTFVHNTGGDGTGIDVGATVWLTNTIVVSHAVGISVKSGETAVLEATLWGAGEWANVTDWVGSGTIVTGTINFWDNPGFVDPTAGDYHIGPSSGALDRGLVTGVIGDIDHQPRPYQAPDLGADEYWPSGVLKHAYLPLVVKGR